MSEVAEGVACSGCSRNYRWKPELAGRKAKCKCGETVRFPAENPAEAVPVLEPVSSEPAEDVLDMSELMDAPSSAPSAQVSTSRCKGCGAGMPEGAVLCTRCGMNQKTGKAMATKVKGPGMEAGEVALVAGRVVLSMVAGGIAALVLAAIWFAILLFTGYSFGILAWLWGLAIGGLMRLINREGGTFSGMMAGCFAFAAVVLPKGIILLLSVSAGLGASGIFSLFDVLWVFLAVSSAYKLATGSD